MKRRWVIPILAAILAMVTTLAIIGYLQTLRRQTAVVAPVQTEAVVFARTNIADRTVVRADALELRQVPVTAIHPQAARHLEEVANRVVVAAIVADEQVLLSRLAPPGVNVGLAYTLPKDKRAMTIALNEVIGVAGFVFPGDHVDVVGTVTLNDVSFTKIVLQNVEVVAIAQKVETKPGEEPRVTTSATLALTPDQAEVLAQIDTSGKVRLALRPYGVTNQAQTTGKTIQTAVGLEAPSKATVAKTQASAIRPVARRSARRPVARVAESSARTQPSGLPDPPLPITREPFPAPARMQLIGLATTSDGRKVAIVVADTQIYILEPGRTVNGLTVISIAEDKVILHRGEAIYELYL